jgi:hypothetical protein
MRRQKKKKILLKHFRRSALLCSDVQTKRNEKMMTFTLRLMTYFSEGKEGKRQK